MRVGGPSHTQLILLATLLVLLMGNGSQPSVGAQNATGGSTAESQPASGNASPDSNQFATLFDQWKSLLGQLRDLQKQHQAADQAKQATIQAQWKLLIEQGGELMAKLRTAALAAYKEQPGQDPQISQFLVGLLKDEIHTDNYEPASELALALIEGGSNDPDLADLAGRAAWASNDWDTAEKYLQQAERAGHLSEVGKNYLSEIAEQKRLWKDEEQVRSKEAAADDLPRVKLKTSKGDIVVELFENEAPQTVGNFVSLVEKGFYDGLAFHRVLPGFMAQGGCPKGDGTGGPGYTIYCECYNDNHRKHFRGSLSMAKGSARNSGGSQFFLTFLPTPHLNGKHTVFGRVIEGMDVLAKLRRRDPEGVQAPADVEPDTIVSAEVVRKRPHEYAPTKAP